MAPVNACLGFTLKCAAGAAVIAAGMLALDATAQPLRRKRLQRPEGVRGRRRGRRCLGPHLQGRHHRRCCWRDERCRPLSRQYRDHRRGLARKTVRLDRRDGVRPPPLQLGRCRRTTSPARCRASTISKSRARAPRLYQLWLEQEFADGRGKRAGRPLRSQQRILPDRGGRAPDRARLRDRFGACRHRAERAVDLPVDGAGPARRAGMWPTAIGSRAPCSTPSAGVIGDPDGVDLSFDNGALLIGEWVQTATCRCVSAHGPTPKSRTTSATSMVSATADAHRRMASMPALRASSAAFGDSTISGFVRAGASDGTTTPYLGRLASRRAGVAGVRRRGPTAPFSIGRQPGPDQLAPARQRARSWRQRRHGRVGGRDHLCRQDRRKSHAAAGSAVHPQSGRG